MAGAQQYRDVEVLFVLRAILRGLCLRWITTMFERRFARPLTENQVRYIKNKYGRDPRFGTPVANAPNFGSSSNRRSGEYPETDNVLGIDFSQFPRQDAVLPQASLRVSDFPRAGAAVAAGASSAPAAASAAAIAMPALAPHPPTEYPRLDPLSRPDEDILNMCTAAATDLNPLYYGYQGEDVDAECDEIDECFNADMNVHMDLRMDPYTGPLLNQSQNHFDLPRGTDFFQFGHNTANAGEQKLTTTGATEANQGQDFTFLDASTRENAFEDFNCGDGDVDMDFLGDTDVAALLQQQQELHQQRLQQQQQQEQLLQHEVQSFMAQRQLLIKKAHALAAHRQSLSPGSSVPGCHDDTFHASGAPLGSQEHHAAHSRRPYVPNAGDFTNADAMFQQQTMQFASLENPLLQPALAPREGGHLSLQACPEVEEDIDDEEEEDDDDEEGEEGEEGGEGEEGEEEEEDDDDEYDEYDYEEPPTRPGRRKMPYQFIKTAPLTEEEEDAFWVKWDAFQEKMKPILAKLHAKREAKERKAAQRKAAQRKAAQRDAAQRDAAQRDAAQRDAAQRDAAQREGVVVC
ncbi:hypothetical protein E4U49_002776 [Claviceps purpurea]|nr:hypothetical protein E4U49_002776 [Claviceps purpurea]